MKCIRTILSYLPCRASYLLAGRSGKRPSGSSGKTPGPAAGVALTVVGLALLSINCYGTLFASLRSPFTVDYRDFSGIPILTYEDAIRRLHAIPGGDPLLIADQATRIIHEGMAHIDADDCKSLGLQSLRMTVPLWENYILFALAHLLPSTYQDYEFCDYQLSLSRGVGRCGQQSLTLVDFLSRRGLATGFVNLGGHTLVTAEVGPGQWVLLDPDYGGVIPFSIAEAELAPESVIPHYWGDPIVIHNMYKLFDARHNEVHLGGSSARWGRASWIESCSYAMKWALPTAMLMHGAILVRRSRRCLQL